MDPRLEKVLKLPLYQRLLILVALMLVIAGLFVYLMYLPMREELAALQQKDASLQSKIQEDQRIADNLPKFKAEFEKMEALLNDALTELPNEKEIPNLLTSITALAKENGLNVTLFKPGAEKPMGFYAEVPVELKMVGSYHEVALFSDAVAKLPRIVNINNLTLASPKEEGGRVLLAVNCLATTFRFIEGGTAPDAGKQPGKGGKK
ncbi:MAG: type 4a pilus biogenesis protein PilO [Trichloromonas sp.]|jgi:type IV pilus assembly protein PilO|nr:type 4a pilus biogenesis protein PilO [Trichloromonas sp.]